MNDRWSPIVRTLSPYTPGEQPDDTEVVKLNTNENPYGPSPQALAAIIAATNDTLRLYPDPNASALKTALARAEGMLPSEVFVGNGSDEVLAHIFLGLLKHDWPVLFPDITYSFYPVYCALYEVEYLTVPLAADFSIDLDDYRQANGGVIVANPNAPTGLALPVAAI